MEIIKPTSSGEQYWLLQKIEALNNANYTIVTVPVYSYSSAKSNLSTQLSLGMEQYISKADMYLRFHSGDRIFVNTNSEEFKNIFSANPKGTYNRYLTFVLLNAWATGMSQRFKKKLKYFELDFKKIEVTAKHACISGTLTNEDPTKFEFSIWSSISSPEDWEYVVPLDLVYNIKIYSYDSSPEDVYASVALSNLSFDEFFSLYKKSARE